MYKYLGLDIGNDSIKVCGDNNKILARIPTVVGELIKERNFQRDAATKAVIPENNLDVTVTLNGVEMPRFAVGNLAFKGATLETTGNKCNNEYAIAAALTAIAFSEFDYKNPVKTVRLILGASLPVEEYFYEEDGEYVNVPVFKNNLIGTHKVTFNNECFNEAEVTLIIDDVAVIPEGAGALISLLCDEDLNIIKPELLGTLMLGIDMGNGSTDFSAMKDFEYDTRGFFGINYGIGTPLSEIAEEVEAKGFPVNRHEVDMYLRSTKYNGVIELSSGPIDLKEMIAPKIKSLVDFKVMQEFNKKNKIPLKEIQVIVLFGGGSRLANKDLIRNLKKLNKDWRFIEVDNPEDRNAIGNMFMAKQLAKKKNAANDTILAETAATKQLTKK